ncbi:hypothetical protein FBQ87_07785 [Sphingobacteriales bacterium CHB3]|nr:hypothetical protein [Sphingobacteriales bacterium CHB3]
MYTKNVGFHQLYFSDEEVKKRVPPVEHTYYHLGHLKRFTGTHPAVMKERIAVSQWNFDSKIDEQPPDWWRHVMLFLQPLTKRLQRWFGTAKKG